MTAIYRIRSGDTLSRVAEFHKVPLRHLLDLNPQIEKPDVIYAGQSVNVPYVEDEGLSIHAASAGDADPLWLAIALREMDTGVEEIVGPNAHNPRIIEYHSATSLGATDDETPWCSSFVNWCMMKANLPRTDSAMARSWLRWGVDLDEPRRGCVVVFSRPPSPTSGHVAFYINLDGGRVYVLGGNQSNQVNITGYPFSRVLGYRWPQ